MALILEPHEYGGLSRFLILIEDLNPALESATLTGCAQIA